MEYSPDFKKNFATAYLAEEYERLLKGAAEAVASAAGDPELAQMAAEDVATAGVRQKAILAEIQQILDKEKEEVVRPSSMVMELRAGAGGDEANIFARELKDMYQKYAESRGWRTTSVDDLTLEINGAEAYDALQFETGVHRVQRVPLTEKMGRVHTSTASIAVLPIRAYSKIEINPADI